MFLSKTALSTRFFVPPIPLSIFALLMLLSSCNVTQYLQNEQHIVASNKIQFHNVASKRQRNALEPSLSTLFRQRDLPTFLGYRTKIGAWFYFKNDTSTRFKRWMTNNFARKPAIFDAELTDATVENMKSYLRNSGYLYPSVYYDKDFGGKDKGLGSVIYHVDPGRLYVFDTIKFNCSDSLVQEILAKIAPNSSLQRGQTLNSGLYEQEKQRITDALNNQGYARFTPNYILPLESDTTELRYDAKGNRLVNAVLTVQVPNDRPTHQKFYTGEVLVYPNFDARRGETIAHDTIIDNKIFFTYDGKLGLKAGPLSNAIQIQPGNVYKKDDSDKTFRQLSNLGIYKFVNIKPLIDECDSNAITYKVYLTHNKKMNTEGGIELNYANISSPNTGNLARFGAALDAGFTHRNLFNGAERFSTKITLGADIGLNRSEIIPNGTAFDVRFENTLSNPKFVSFSKIWRLYNRLGIVNKRFYTALKENANSDITLNAFFSDRLGLNLYQLLQFNLGYRYVLRRNPAERYIINQTAMEITLSKLNQTFEARLNERNKLSFAPVVLTGLFLRSLNYEYSGKENIANERWQFTGSLEQSGTEIWAIDQLLNRSTPIRLTSDLGFAKFVRAEIDARFTKRFAEKRSFASRLALGLAVPFGDAQAVPYVRQFFVGGPNSVRGWAIQALGPGDFQNTTNFPFQRGDVKFEFNSEYRFPVFWRLESAVFLDAGNVWNLRGTEGVFDKFWYDQTAISTGLGLRIDVTYALIRFDFGFRLRNPYEVDGQNWIPVSKYSFKNNVNTNFALGFPF